MDYRVLLQEENEAVGERISLSMERICAMEGEEMREPYGFYFKRTASFIRMMGELLGRRRESADFLGGKSIEELKEENRRLYGIFSRRPMGRALPTRTMRQKCWGRS